MIKEKLSSHQHWLFSAEALVAMLAIGAMVSHLSLRFIVTVPTVTANYPLLLCLATGGSWLVYGLLKKLVRAEFGSDLLAGIAIVSSVILGEYLAGCLVVLMLSGGEALERYAVARASSALKALSARLPSTAHRKTDGVLEDVALSDIRIGDELVILPHEIAPVDGEVVDGHGSMDEAYLTGEPFEISKAPGSIVISGAINKEHAITMRALKLPQDSRYAKIMEVMRQAELNRPQMRRLGDKLGAFYTPLAVLIAVVAWIVSGDAVRFLSVLVVATPCPLLIAIPVAIIGSVSLAAKRGIVVRDPAVLENVKTCRTMILDKTGTLTYGRPSVTEIISRGIEENDLLTLAAAVEHYSRHPLAHSIVEAATNRGLPIAEAARVHEPPGQGLRGMVNGREILLSSRKLLGEETVRSAGLPESTSGLECIVAIDDKPCGIIRFHDGPRSDSRPFIEHLAGKHGISKIMIVSGDRASEVNYLANEVGIKDVRASQSPEQKVAVVDSEEKLARTIFIGDGINDAPALQVATVGLAFGPNSDVTSEAAGAVIMDASLTRVDEFLHIGARMRRIALESAVGGMILSVVGMLIAATGNLPPVAGALAQEFIDVFAIANALRAAITPESLRDF